jgi:hypothetical protein
VLSSASVTDSLSAVGNTLRKNRRETCVSPNSGLPSSYGDLLKLLGLPDAYILWPIPFTSQPISTYMPNPSHWSATHKTNV